jgi:phosphoglycolate phosphatase-like HAD superfamily hydrolase/phosphatidylglycerophosphate synthase/GTP:adenosylcobinamide-phosphate guanylyltransferase
LNRAGSNWGNAMIEGTGQRPSRMVLLAGGSASHRRDRSTPLPLVNVAGISVIERMIAAAADAGFEDIAIIVDCRADATRRHVLNVSRRRGIAVTVIRDDRASDSIRESVSAARDIFGEAPIVLLPVDRVVSPALLKLLKGQTLQSGEVVVTVGRDLYIDSPKEGAARPLLTNVEHWWLPLRTEHDRRDATWRLVESSAKPLDGSLASRINRPLSVLLTRVLVARLSAITSVQVTLLAFVVSAAAASALAVGLPVVAGILIPLAAVLDRADGHIARVTERPSAFGSFLDPVLDRASDGLVIMAAGIYLATDHRLASIAGSAQVSLAIALSGAAMLSHLLVSYSTSKAIIEVGHLYVGPLIGGGRGRDRRLLIISMGAILAAFHPAAVVISMTAVAVLATGIVVSRLSWSWWFTGRGSAVAGVRAVVFDFDATIADSMNFLTELAVGLMVDELGLTRPEATDGYLATTGADFDTQLAELLPGLAAATPIAQRFEAARTTWMPQCKMFPDVLPALDRLKSAGIPVSVCSSTSRRLVHDFCERHDLLRRLISAEGWTPGHNKATQLARAVGGTGFRAEEVVFVGDSRRDADIARMVGTRFVGLVRKGSPDVFEGSGEHVVGSLLSLACGVSRAARSPIEVKRL